MSPAEAQRILEPVWLGFEVALERLAELRAQAEQTKGTEAFRAISDLQEAQAWLLAKARQFQPAGLLTVIDNGAGLIAWPNALPEPGAMETVIQRRRERKRERVA